MQHHEGATENRNLYIEHEGYNNGKYACSVLQSSSVVKFFIEGGPDPWLFVAAREHE